MTLIELIIACAILLLLASTALPIARYSLLRKKEEALRYQLLSIREAIDRYKDATEHQQIKMEIGSSGFPPDLGSLAKEIPLGLNGDKKIRFLRKVPIDPMTGRADWGLRAVDDDPKSLHWGGKNVYDVYSTSEGTALNGTKYKDW